MKLEEIINTIQLGDSYQLIKDIPDKSIDLVYIDIPYLITNMGAGGGMLKNEKRKELYKKTLTPITSGINWGILDQLCRVLKHIYIYIYGAVKNNS